MIDTKMVEASPNNLVTKSNMLIEANYKLGVVEQKIILCLASNIQPTDSDFKTYTLSIKEFNKLLGLKGNPKYTELRQITKELMQKVFEVRIDKKVIQVAWLSFVAYNETEGTIDIRFDPFLRPYLLHLKKEFTSYKLENVVKLKSTYAIRLYELLKQYEKIRERTLPLLELRKMVGAVDIYPAYGNFKQRVLIPAQKELNKKTDISFEIEEIKIGRRVEKIKFVIISSKKKNNNIDKQLSLFEGNLEDTKIEESFSNQMKKLALKLGISISDDLIRNWEKYGQENVLELMQKMTARKDIDNPIGYITTVLKSTTEAFKQVSVSSDEQSILIQLISYFRKSIEPLPNWLIQEKSIEIIQNVLDINFDEASILFNALKADLFLALDINEPNQKENTLEANEEFEKKKKIFYERLKKI
ncbi:MULTISPECIES: replication initiation protein [Bacillaceae]|uniref:replication initiation protein n=1 Tax=Bacillaceae TaxID=186817 RepID=UPI000E2EA460|nr:replication initiation protein [Bacillus sp. HNG]RFB09941.1 replication initiation protein [Bacillus sp. HNG]